MKTNRKEILNELQDLNADFLFNEKERTSSIDHSFELSEDFFHTVMDNIPTSEKSKVIPLQTPSTKRPLTRIFSIAASFVALLAISGIIFSSVFSNKNQVVSEDLQTLVAQTSSDEIIEYLAEYSTTDDEDFLADYISESDLF